MAFYRSQKNPTKVVIATWANGTDEEIAAMLQAHYAGKINIYDYWTVGDERTVSLSAMEAIGVNESHVAQNVVFVLAHAGGKYLSDGVTQCAFQVDQKKALSENGNYNSTQSNVGGWKDSARRTWCNSVYKNAIPQTLIPIFKQFINQSGLGGGSTSGVQNTTDYFALRSEEEVTGEVIYAVSGEGSQVTWYETASNRRKTAGSGLLLRSVSHFNARDILQILFSDLTCAGAGATGKLGIAPFGCI